MKKLLFFTSFFVFIFVGVYLVSGMVLYKLTMKGISQLAFKGNRFGIEMRDASFAGVGLSGLTSVQWKDFTTGIKVNRSGEMVSDREFSLAVDLAELRVVDFQNRLFVFKLKGIRAISEYSDFGKKVSMRGRNRLEGDALEFRFRLDFLSWVNAQEQLRDLSKSLGSLLREGRTYMPTYFEGTSQFIVKDNTLQARLNMKQEGNQYSLRMDSRDLYVISKQLEEELTEDEIELLSENPVRAPRLIQIRDYAQRTAKQAHERSPTVPEDAYRHVLWSFLLRNAYGEAFAKRVTDAHEIGSKTNTEADHHMDFTNNTIGRRYAQEGIAREKILDTLMKDSEVIKAANILENLKPDPAISFLKERKKVTAQLGPSDRLPAGPQKAEQNVDSIRAEALSV